MSPTTRAHREYLRAARAYIGAVAIANKTGAPRHRRDAVICQQIAQERRAAWQTLHVAQRRKRFRIVAKATA